MLNIAQKIAPHFDEVFFDIWEHQHTHYWLDGGRGSTKSSFIGMMIPLLLMSHKDCHAVVMRKVGKTIRNSVFSQIDWGLSELGVRGKFSKKNNPPEFTYLETGQKILFIGVDDKQKIKSLKFPFGYVGLIWYEELDQFAGMDEIRSLNQSLMRGGPEYWVFYSYNPPKSLDAWVNGEALLDEPDRLAHHSTYLGVPRDWLGEQFFYEAEKLKKKNALEYEHEYLGKATGTGGVVFENVEDKQMTDEEIKTFENPFYGLDFGFSIDPLAFLSMAYDAKREDLYIFDEIYQVKLTNKEATALIKPKAGHGRIIADSAEPKSISEMKGYGLFIEGAKKSTDLRKYGFKWLQTRAHIYIDKRRCPNAYREFVQYEYERNREGKFISSYPDGNDHCLDACRYGCSRLMRGDSNWEHLTK